MTDEERKNYIEATVELSAIKRQVAKLQFEMDGLRADAERYKYLCQNQGPGPIVCEWSDWEVRFAPFFCAKEGIDAAIDAARKA